MPPPSIITWTTSWMRLPTMRLPRAYVASAWAPLPPKPYAGFQPPQPTEMPVYDTFDTSLCEIDEFSVKPTKMPTAPWYSTPTRVTTFFSTTLSTVRRDGIVVGDQVDSSPSWIPHPEMSSNRFAETTLRWLPFSIDKAAAPTRENTLFSIRKSRADESVTADGIRVMASKPGWTSWTPVTS